VAAQSKQVEPIYIIKLGYQRYAARNFAGVFELLADDIVVWQTDELPWGGEHHGHQGAKKFFSLLAATPEPMALIPAGNHVAVYSMLRGKQTRPATRSTSILFTFGRSRTTRSTASKSSSAHPQCLSL
jgi:ketosteroid isomerase-like protein